jgi:iron complex outermembrane receptor protein
MKLEKIASGNMRHLGGLVHRLGERHLLVAEPTIPGRLASSTTAVVNTGEWTVIKTRYARLGSLLWKAGMLFFLSASASAQTTGSGASATASQSTDSAIAQSSGLEEVVVTATRRETRLQDTPISMTALSGADLDRNRVLTMVDVAQQVPGLTYIPDSGSETYLVMRGAATIDDSTGTDQGVSMFVDDVVRVSIADLQPELFDMDRVEVLNGPQGTLFGRNAIGGVVSLYTKDPTFKEDNAEELTYGRYNLFEVKGMLNLPLSDTLAARLVVSRHANDGYIDDITTHNYAGNQDTLAARGKLLFKPSDNLRFVGGFDYLSKVGTDAKWVIGNFQPSLDPGLTFDPLQTAQSIPSRYTQRIWGLTGRMDWNTAYGDLTSISGYRHLYVNDQSVQLGDPLVVEDLKTTSMDRQITEEIRFASPANQTLSWVTGVYFLHSDRSRPIDVPVVVLPGSFLSLITGVPPSIAPYHLDQDTRTVSYAGFADATYAFSKEWKLDVGGRYTWEQKSGSSFVNLSGIVIGPAISGDYSDSWAAFTPKFTLSYQPTQALLTYATISRGFQSGGFNVQGSTDAALRDPFSSEFLMNYETGVKLDTLDHRLQANISAFTDRYTDLQIIEYDSANLTFVTNNAGKADVDGIESNFAVAPTDWLVLGIKYDYLYTKFTDYVVNNGPGLAPSVYTGNRLPFSPEDSVTVSGELHFNAPKLHGRVAFGGDYTYRSPMELAVANNTPEDVYSRTAWSGVINLHASWRSEDDRWEAVLWGKNVTNVHFTSLAANQSIFVLSPTEANNPALHLFDARFVDPAWYGLTVRLKL